MTKEELRKSLDFVNEEIERLQKENDELQQRIEKAIDYIEKHETFSYDENCNIIGGYEINDLLNILRGKDK